MMKSKLPTPSTSHVNFSTIYEPAEDSFLFLDTLSSDAESSFLKARFTSYTDKGKDYRPSSSPLVLEVGTGSGVILAFVTAHSEKIFGRSDVLTLGVDVNEDACRETSGTVARAVSETQRTSHEQHTVDAVNGAESANDSATAGDETRVTTPRKTKSGLYLGNIRTDLTTALRPCSIDVLLFNPPYVPTEQLPDPTNSKHKDRFEEESHLLALSYAGGLDGMEVTERLLDQLPHILSLTGVAYVLFCARNNPQQALQRFLQRAKREAAPGWEWAAETVRKTGGKGGWERLEIVRIWRRWEGEKSEVKDNKV